ncbi:MAG: branched-chain-amino-acid transaminase [Elusimicrobiota bacterium]|nr:branched-chain-amino-acid transaminase [Elusimicrobiota bacterium]MDH5662658.1 branched-chain-amino-acid transaminase [Elusimicrobiota bacterium]
MEKIFLNGSFVNLSRARISVFDRGFLYGDGLFETMRAYCGEVFRLEDHLDRLFRSAREIELSFSYTREKLKNIIERIIKINNLSEAYIRLTISRGVSQPGLISKPKASATLVIVAKEFKPLSPSEYGRGWRATIVETRQNQASPLSRLKSLNFLNNILARKEAKAKRFDEGILLNTSGDVTESSTGNIFLVKRDSIITPPEVAGLLAGITRGVVLELATSLGLKVFDRKVSPDELMGAEEAFLTNSLIEIMPLVEIDSRRIGKGKPGPVTERIHKAYKNLVKREIAIKR